MELSYSPIVSASKVHSIQRNLSLQRSTKSDIVSRHFETNTQRPGRSRPLSVTSSRPRDLSWQACFVLEVMADLQPYNFEPERVPNPEDSESENKEVNDWLEDTFWCTCERCEIMPTRRECVCCQEQPEAENKMEGIIFSIIILHWSQ